jgi:hypothetical protein
MNTIQHVRAELRRFSDLDIMELKKLLDAEHSRRFDAEKQSKESMTG